MNNFIHKYIFCAGKIYYSNLWVNYSHYSNSFPKFPQGHSLPLALTAALSSLHSSFVKVVKRTSSLRLVDDHRLAFVVRTRALNQGVTFRDSLVNVSRREVNQSHESG